MFLTALLVVAVVVVLMVRRVEVRLVLLGGGIALSLLAGQPLLPFDVFTRSMVTAMVAPICASMGFAAVMAKTGCDRQLVILLLAPIRRLRWLVIPGGILAAYLVNVAVPSQASTAAALGPILVPLLLAAGHGPDIAGAALILGASFGGDLLNPGAQDVQSVSAAAGVNAAALSARVVPASIVGILVATLVFTAMYARPGRPAPIDTTAPRDLTGEPLHVGKALVPLLPVAMLLLAYGGFAPLQWLVRSPPGAEWAQLTGALPVVRAMLIGVVVACVIGWRELQPLVRSLFEGMGQAYASIISLTITAQVFGAGIAAVGIAGVLLRASAESNALPALSAAFPWTLSVLSGSGSGPILTFAQTFLAPLGATDPVQSVTLAALACLGGAFGRTMSPVSAVVVYSAGLVSLSPLPLIKRLLPSLLVGAAAAIAMTVLRI